MFSVFVRQNSQVIAAGLISGKALFLILEIKIQIILIDFIKGYIGLSVFNKIFYGKLNKDAYDFKTLNRITLGLSLREEEEAKKVPILRINLIHLNCWLIIKIHLRFSTD